MKRFRYSMNSKNQVTYVRAIQGHTGGSMISPELMGHVEIPYNWKSVIFHAGSSNHLNSIMDRTHNWWKRKWRTQMVFFIPLNPSRENSDEEIQDESLTSTLSQCLERQTSYSIVRLFGSRTRPKFTNLVNKVQCSCHLRSRASNLHQRSHLSKRRTNFV